MDCKFRTHFFAEAKIIEANDELKQQAFASLHSLKSIIPAGFNPEKDTDLLYLASPLVRLDWSNANGDCLTREVALSSYKGFINRLLDIEHDRKKIVGNIIMAVITDADTNEIIPDDKVLDYAGTLQIVYAAYMWKVANPKLAEFLTRASNPSSEYHNTISSSFEVGFNDYIIAVGDKNVRKAKLITDEDEIELYSKFLLSSPGGVGKDRNGNFVYRVLQDCYPFGAGLVSRPASQVKGVLTIESLVETVEDDEDDDEENETEDTESSANQSVKKEVEDKNAVTKSELKTETAANTEIVKDAKTSVQESVATEKTAKIDIQKEKVSVTPNITQPMDIKKLDDITANAAELFKNEAHASVITKFIAEQIAKISEEKVAEMKKRDDMAKTLEEAKAAAEAKVAELSKNVSDLASKLNEIEAAKAAEAAEKLFQERMKGFDEEYELNDEERTLIASEIKGMNDESFDAYLKKFKVLAKEKSKAFKTAKAKELTEKLAQANVKAKVDEKTLNVSEIVASVTEVKQADLPNAVKPVEPTLLEKMKKAFSPENVTLNGKPLNK